MRAFFCALLISVCLFAAKGQNINVAGVFPTIDHSGDLSAKFGYSLYYFAAFPLLNFHNPNVFNDAYFNLLYFEQALSYKVNPKLFFSGSYLYQRANVVYNDYVNENRFYVQAKYRHSFGKVNLTQRLRFDGRFLQNRITKESPFTHRVRYLIGADFPVSEKAYFTVYEEGFFNTFANADVIFGENWAYAAFGKKLNDMNKIEIGILNVSWNIGNSNWFNQYYLQLTWISHLDFRKNKI